MCATTKYCKSSPGGSACSTVKKTNFASALLLLLHGHPKISVPNIGFFEGKLKVDTYFWQIETF